MLKRVLSSLILLPLVVAIVVFGNKYLIDFTLSIVAIMSLYEYFNSFKDAKEKRNIHALGYVCAILIAFIHVINQRYVLYFIGAIIPFSILILFLQVILTDMKYNIKDISSVLFGICYIVLFLVFLSLIRQTPNGKITIWFVFLAAWGTDIFAYFIGRKIGKHKISKISPNKSLEGCIAGILGSVICVLIYTVICNNFLNTNFNYLSLTIIAVILSIIAQIGDFAASSIKRYNNIKDFSNLIPGHGGMLDRIDSIIFISPFAYFLLMLI